MDINNLKAFIEVADKKSFSRSAMSLNLTQPAISKRIAALESALSAKLFDRVGRSVHLTEAGRLLLPCARQIRFEMSRIEDVICNLGKDVSGVLSIGNSEHIGTHHLLGVLKPFRENHPNVEINLRFDSTDETLHAVEQGQLELALCSHSDTLNASPKLSSLEIWSDTLEVVVANHHPLATNSSDGDGTTTLEELVIKQSILPPLHTATRHSLDNILQAINQDTSTCIEANDFETIKAMVSIGLGWACLPRYLVDNSMTVLRVKELQIDFSIALVRHQERTLSRAADAFINTLSAINPTNMAKTLKEEDIQFIQPNVQGYDLPSDSALDHADNGQLKPTPS